MILDGRQIAPGQELEGDLAIIGAGAAGITLARRMAELGHRVLVFESGGLEYEEPTQQLYRGSAEGEALGPGNEYLAASRLRYLGGSSNHWAGFCHPLDAMDFDALPWVADSGWPIGPDDLRPYYRAAAKVLKIPPIEPDPDDHTAGGLGLAAGTPLRTPVFHMSKVRHRVDYGGELETSERIRVVTRANVTELALARDGGSVDHLELAVLDGPRFKGRARATVLAVGGIENARLLLASRSVQQDGIGNREDLVGRYFMDHPHRSLGPMILARPPANTALWAYWSGPSKRELAMLAVTPAMRRLRQLTNALVRVVAQPRHGSPEPDGAVERALVAEDRRLHPEVPGDSVVAAGSLYIQAEQVPNRASRVLLDDEVDALGVPRARLEWRLQSQDLQTLAAFSEIVARELGRSGVGRATIFDPTATGWKGTIAGNHHMGTTRMAATPQKGVVDPDGRVFGVENLFVAGSSVFPTSGAANPTFTITALTLRLADRLHRELAGA